MVWEEKSFLVCHQQQAEWIGEYIGEDFYYTFYFIFRVIFVHLIPCVMLIVLNILLFRAMRLAQQKRQKLFDKCCKKSKRANDKNCTTLMLIIVVSVFLVVEIPLAIITALHVISSLFINFLDYRIANLCILFANFFLIMSYPVNALLLCGMSRQFRETFREIFCRRSSSTNGNVTTILGGSKKHHEMSSRYSLVNTNGPKTNTTNETVL
jgi:neuromedin U receptor 1